MLSTEYHIVLSSANFWYTEHPPKYITPVPRCMGVLEMVQYAIQDCM